MSILERPEPTETEHEIIASMSTDPQVIEYIDMVINAKIVDLVFDDAWQRLDAYTDEELVNELAVLLRQVKRLTDAYISAGHIVAREVEAGQLDSGNA